MKKIFIVILLALSTMYLKADMGSPEVPEFEAIVINHEGAKVYDESKDEKNDPIYSTTGEIIEYDSKITIFGEYLYESELYGYVLNNDDEDNETKIVKLSDVRTLKNKYDPSDDEMLDEESTAYVFNKEGAQMYAGPSKKYDKLNVIIPTGSIVKYLAASPGDPHSWIYVEYNGQKGWVTFLQINEAIYYEESFVASQEDYIGMVINVNSDSIKVYDFPEEKTANVLGSIDKDEIVACKYSYGYFMEWCYVEHENLKGWTMLENNSAFIEDNDGKEVLTIKDTKLFKEPNSKEKAAVTVPKETKLEYDYIFYHYNGGDGGPKWLRVKYNNKNYWLLTLSYDAELEDYEDIDSMKTCFVPTAAVVSDEYYEEYFDESSKRTIYSERDKSSDIVAEYNNEEILEMYELDNEESWNYIKTSDYSGWFLLDDEEEEKINKEIEKIETEKEKKETTVKPNTNKETKENSLTHKQIIYISIGAAVIIALTSFVTILLVNKKRKSKKSDINQNTNITQVTPSNTEINQNTNTEVNTVIPSNTEEIKKEE